MQPLVRLVSYEEKHGLGVITTKFSYEVAGGVRYPIELDWEALQSVTTIFDYSQLKIF